MDPKQELALARDINGISGVAQRLLANNMDPESLRTNTTLRAREWKAVDEAALDVARTRLVGVNRLIARGLTFPLANPLGSTVLEYDDNSDMNDGELTMDGVSRGPDDRVDYSVQSLPLPIAHKSFHVNVRALNASRTRGESLDATQSRIATRKVADVTEDLLYTGGSNLAFGGGTIYGYMDHPDRNTVTLGTNWDASAATASGIKDQVIEMKAASQADKHYGPWDLHVPAAYEAVLDGDYSTSTNTITTIRERIMQIAGIESIIVADALTANNVVLVELSQETQRVVVGMMPTPVEWETEGGLVMHFKIMAILVPQLRADFNGNMGLVHMS